MTYKIYYDDREIKNISEIKNKITDLLDRYAYQALYQREQIEKTIKEIKAYQSDNENFISDYKNYYKSENDLRLAYKYQDENEENIYNFFIFLEHIDIDDDLNIELHLRNLNINKRINKNK